MKPVDESAEPRDRRSPVTLIAVVLVVLVILLPVAYFAAWLPMAILLHTKLGVPEGLAEATVLPMQWLYEAWPAYEAYIDWQVSWLPSP